MYSTSAYVSGSGIIMITTPDGKIYNIKVSNVTLEFNTSAEEYVLYTAGGSLAVNHPTVTTTVDLRGVTNGITVVDTSKTSSD